MKQQDVEMTLLIFQHEDDEELVDHLNNKIFSSNDKHLK